MWDQRTGRSRGFGFVSFRNQQVWYHTLFLLIPCVVRSCCADDLKPMNFYRMQTGQLMRWLVGHLNPFLHILYIMTFTNLLLLSNLILFNQGNGYVVEQYVAIGLPNLEQFLVKTKSKFKMRTKVLRVEWHILLEQVVGASIPFIYMKFIRFLRIGCMKGKYHKKWNCRSI